MLVRMKTTLVLDDTVAARLRREAERRGTTMSRLVEDALRRYLEDRAAKPPLPPLPSFDGGKMLVDVSDRDALYRAMEEEEEP
jgi:hypothetical protein